MVLRIADVSAEAILLAGGARAILLQIANPDIARSVAEHSDFAHRPLDRLRGTLTYLYVTVYGTPDEAAEAARRVGGAHRPVPGATDPELQLWVAATLYDTAMRVRELVFGPPELVDAESLLADYAVIATALGVPRAMWPSDLAVFALYWHHELDGLRVDAAAQRVAQELLHPRRGPLWLKASMPTVRTITAGLLHEPLRRAYELPLHQRRFDRLVRVVRALYPRLPLSLRHAPKRHYLKAFRRSR